MSKLIKLSEVTNTTTKSFLNRIWHANDRTALEFKYTKKDINFQKVWAYKFFKATRCIMNNKFLVLEYILLETDRKNYFNESLRTISKKTGVSLTTVHKTIQGLRVFDFMRVSTDGGYIINPWIVCALHNEDRQELMDKFLDCPEYIITGNATEEEATA